MIRPYYLCGHCHNGQFRPTWNWISSTPHLHLECTVCWPWWATRPLSIMGASRWRAIPLAARSRGRRNQEALVRSAILVIGVAIGTLHVGDITQVPNWAGLDFKKSADAFAIYVGRRKIRHRPNPLYAAAQVIDSDESDQVAWVLERTLTVQCLFSASYPRRTAAEVNKTSGFKKMAERVGFEPTEPVKVQRFSRPPDSTALAPLRCGVFFSF